MTPAAPSFDAPAQEGASGDSDSSAARPREHCRSRHNEWHGLALLALWSGWTNEPSSERPCHWLPAHVSGPYEILGLVGAGGMGEVYRARDPRLGREVAVKVLPAQVASDPERLSRFEREARAVAALNHPNILTVFDVGTEAVAATAAATRYVVTELLSAKHPFRRDTTVATLTAILEDTPAELSSLTRDVPTW